METKSCVEKSIFAETTVPTDVQLHLPPPDSTPIWKDPVWLAEIDDTTLGESE